MAVVGIDLGTTNTVIAAVRDGRATALKDKLGRALLPSVVSFTPKGTAKVGYEAKDRRTIDPENTIFSIKRLIGRTFDSEHVKKAISRFPFELKEGPGKSVLVSAYGSDHTLPEISALVLGQAQKIAEARLGTDVTDAVITVPANFNDLQRAATKVAGRTAGLEVLRIINEPTAAALAYGFGKKGRERIAVYDFGGGTFDVTLLDLSENVFEVLATAGDTFLGGDDIDRAILDEMATQLLKTHKVDAHADNLVREQLRAAAETLKIELSTRSMAKVRVEELEFDFTMRRSEFEKLVEPLLARTLEVCKEAMDVADVANRDLDQILMVGGSTRIPLVRRRISSFFGKMPQSRINPDEVVAIGAAIQAASLEAKQAGGASIPAAPKPRAAQGISPSAHPSRAPDPLGPAPGQTTKTGLAGLKRTLTGQGGTSPPPAVDLSAVKSVPPAVGTPGKKLGPAKTLSGVGPSNHPSSPPVAALGSPQRKIHKTLAGVGLDDSSDVPRDPMRTLSGVGDEQPPARTRANTLSGLSDRPKGSTNLGLGAHPSSPPPLVGKAPPSTRDVAGAEPDPADFEDVTTVNEGAIKVAQELEKRKKQETLPGTGDSAPLFPDSDELDDETTDGSVTFDLAELEATAGETSTFEDAPSDEFSTIDDETTEIVDPHKVAAQAASLDRQASPSDDEPEELGGSALIAFEEADLPSPAADLPSPASRKPQEIGASSLLALDEDDFDDVSGVDLPAPAADLPAPARPKAGLPAPARGEGLPSPLGRTEVGLPSPFASGNRDLPAPASTDEVGLPLIGDDTRKESTRAPAAERGLGLGRTQVATSQAPNFGAARDRAPSVDDLDELSVAALLPEDDGEADLSAAPLNLAGSALDLGRGTRAQGSDLSSTQKAGSRAPVPAPAPAPAPARPLASPLTSPLGSTVVGQGLYGHGTPTAPSDHPPAPGVAVPPGQLRGGGPLLLDVTPLSLGVEVTGGYVDRLIERNSPIPCEKTRTFATAQDNQSVVRVRVSQGEEERFNRNTLLGEVELTGISRGPRGSVRIDVSFSLDESGMLQVSARDLGTGNAANARLMLVGVAPSAE